MENLKNDLVRNEADYPAIFGLTEYEVIAIKEAVQNYSHPQDGEKDSQSYKDWCKMYNGIHREWEHDVKLRNWLACMRWISQHNNWQEKFYEFDTNLPIKPMAANINERIAWLEENYILIPKTTLK